MELQDKYTGEIVECLQTVYGGIIAVRGENGTYVDIAENYYPVGAWQEVEPEHQVTPEPYDEW